MVLRVFDEEQMEILSRAVSGAEELVSGYYRLSDSDWSSIRYDFVTIAGLVPSEITGDHLGQVLRYRARPNDSVHEAESYDFYKICIQDSSILEVIEKNHGLDLFAFLLYIAAHELVHVVRFSRFMQGFEASDSERLSEEKKVHEITRGILSKLNIHGMKDILSFYDTWQHRV